MIRHEYGNIDFSINTMTHHWQHREHKGFIHWLDRHSVRLAAWFALAALYIGTIGHLVEFTQAATLGKSETFGFWVHAVLMSIYHTILFFALEAGADKTLDWSLDIARVLALVAFILITGKALGLIFRSHYDRLKVRGAKGHVIIVGLHEDSLAMVRHYREPEGGRKKTEVIVIERDEQNPHISRCRALGASVLTQDARDPAVLREAGVAQARLMICMGPDDANADVASVVEEILLKDHRAAKREEKLRILIHINTPGLANRLCISDTLGGIARPCWFEYFNCDERTVDAILEEHAPFGTSANIECTDAHALVVGDSRLAKLLVASLLNRWNSEAPEALLKRPFVTVVCKNADAWKESIEEVVCLPAERITNVRFQPFTGILVADTSAFMPTRDLPAPTIIYVTGECDSAALDTALQIQNLACAAGCKGKIVACMNGGEGLSNLVHAIPTGNGVIAGIVPFCAREELCKVLELTLRERIARAVHKNYLADREEEGKTMDDPNLPAMRTWENLSGHLRDDNRSQASSYAEALALRGWSIVPASLTNGRGATLSSFDIETLAEREHARWMKGKEKAGYVFGPDYKNKGPRKTHPDLIPYKDLSDKTKDKDRRPFAHVTEILAAEGLGLRKN
jgi:hypothetical protein